MKQLLIIIMGAFVILLCGCNEKTENDFILQKSDSGYEINSSSQTESNTDIYMKEEIIDFNLDNMGESYSKWLGITDSETACDISIALLKQFQRQKKFKDYSLQSLEHDPDIGIWVANFAESKENLTPGASLSIALREDTGEIIGIWIGE